MNIFGQLLRQSLTFSFGYPYYVPLHDADDITAKMMQSDVVEILPFRKRFG